MLQVYGKSITAEEIKQEISRDSFTPQKFASLCNSIIWRLAGTQRPSTIPSFSERVNVGDGGVDAHWDIDLSNGQINGSSLLGVGWNVFQYKKRNVFADSFSLGKLKEGLKGAVKEVFDNSGKRPKTYTLFVNYDFVDSKPKPKSQKTAQNNKVSTKSSKSTKNTPPQLPKGQKEQLKDAILEGYDQPNDVKVKIIGAGELAAILNDFPHLRHTFFVVGSKFQTWDKYWEQHVKELGTLGSAIKFTGRQAQVTSITEALQCPETKAVIISGPKGIGKTRFALEVTKYRQDEIIVALEPSLVTVQDIRELTVENNVELVVLVENPTQELAEGLIKYVLGIDNIKLLLTFSAKADIPKIIFQEDRIKMVDLQPLQFMEAIELLKATGAKFDHAEESWAIEHSDLYPEFLILAASQASNIKSSSLDFLEKISEAFEDKISRKYGKQTIENLQLLSILYKIFVNKDNSELETICNLFDNTTSKVNLVLNDLEWLTREGLIIVNNSHLEVRPLFFANYLATKILKWQGNKLERLFLSLDYYGRLRLLQRLSYIDPNIDPNIVNPFWIAVENFFVKDFQKAISTGELIVTFAKVLPEKAAYFLQSNLQSLSYEERSSLPERRDLISTIKVLLYRKITCVAGLYCLAWLAETEEINSNGNLENNTYETVTSLFCKYFCGIHAQSPLPLNDRLGVIRRIISEENSEMLHILGTRTIGRAFEFSKDFILSNYPSTAKPYDGNPQIFYEQLWKYNEKLINLLIEQVYSKNKKLVRLARHILCDVLRNCAIQLDYSYIRPLGIKAETLIVKFQRISSDVFSQNISLPISKLIDSIIIAQGALKKHRDKVEKSNNANDTKVVEYKKRIDSYIQNLDDLLSQFDEGIFFLQLQRWAGEGRDCSAQYYKEVGKEGSRVIYRGEKELQLLAEKSIAKPEILTAEVLQWLCLEANRAGVFCHWLGQLDKNHIFVDKMEKLATQQEGVMVFTCYFEGLSKTDQTFVSNQLDILTEAKQVLAEAIVRATNEVGKNLKGVERVLKLIEEKRISVELAGKILRNREWVKDLPTDKCCTLLKVLSGQNFEYVSNVIDLVWFNFNQPIEEPLREFLWQCLENTYSHFDFRYDQLAAILSQYDIERGFRLLARLLENNLNLIRNTNHNHFWKGLIGNNRECTIRLVLQITLNKSRADLVKYSKLTSVFDQQRDSGLLLEYAFEEEEQAVLLCNCVALSPSNIVKIFEKYSNNRKVQEYLADNLLWPRGMTYPVPDASYFKARHKQVEQMLNDPTTPNSCVSWLENIEGYLQKCIEAETEKEGKESYRNYDDEWDDDWD